MVLLGMLCMVFFASSALANNDAKDYIPAPPGTAIAIFYFNNSSGNELYAHGNRATSDANLTANVGVFRGGYYFQVFGMPALVNALLPYGHLSMDGAAIGDAQSTSQMGDSILAAGIWPYANPNTKTYFGLFGYLTVPLGEYRNDRMLNMGSNRFAFKGEAGVEQGLGKSGFNIGIYGNVEFYTDNNDYTSLGETYKQDPIFGAEAHLSYDFTKSLYAGFDYFYKGGGKTEVQGITNDDRLSTHSLGIHLAYLVSPQLQLELKYTKDLSVENGTTTDIDSRRLAYFF